MIGLGSGCGVGPSSTDLSVALGYSCTPIMGGQGPVTAVSVASLE
jgi:hypothetical protein